MYGYFCTTTAELSGYNSNQVAHKSKTIFYLYLYRKYFLTPVLEKIIFAPVSNCQGAKKLTVEIVMYMSPVCLFCSGSDPAVSLELGKKTVRET